MYVSITLDGVIYNSKSEKFMSEKDFKKVVDIMKENMGDLNSMHLELDSGDFLIIGKDAVQKAAIVIHKGNIINAHSI